MVSLHSTPIHPSINKSLNQRTIRVHHKVQGFCDKLIIKDNHIEVRDMIARI